MTPANPPGEGGDFRFGQTFTCPPPSPLRAVAFHGLLGDIVRTLDPYTEASVEALLFTGLAQVGNIFGRSPHFDVGGTLHRCNLYVCLVGPTSSGRKGSALRAISTITSRADREWFRGCVNSGLSSGEGVIYAVRDPVWKLKARRDSHGDVIQEHELIDAGVADKRLLIIQEELGSALLAIQRTGNILSPTLRLGWDDEDLGTMTKTPMRATAPHISVIAHITMAEMVRNFSSIEIANGLGNPRANMSRSLLDSLTHSELAGRSRSLMNA